MRFDDDQEQSVEDFVMVMLAVGFVVFAMGMAFGAWLGGCPL